MVDVCECAANWRVELTNFLTGAVQASIVPISFEFETAFMEPGRGSITFNRLNRYGDTGLGPLFADRMFPGTAGIYFQRLAGGTATPADPANMFGGYIETMQGNSDGTVTLGFAELPKYLDSRMIRSDLVFTNDWQTDIGANLVLYAFGGNTNGGSVDPSPALGPPLIGGFGSSAVNRDRTYLAVDRPMIGDLIRNLVQVEDGPVYELFHYRNGSPIPGLTENWYSEMGFFDTFFQPDPSPWVLFPHVTDFSVNMDGNGLANQIDAFGEPGPDGEPLIATQDSPTPFLVRFDAAPSFPGVTQIATLNGHAFGYQSDHRNPALNLQLNFTGLDYAREEGIPALSIDDLIPGRHLNIDISSPAWRITGGPQFPEAGTQIPSIGRVSVAVGQEGAEQVTVQVILDDYPGGFLGTNPEDCVDC